MSATIIYAGEATTAADARAEGDQLWLSAADLRRATGWELKPEGVCRGEVCIPIPPGRQSKFVGAGDALNLAAFARHLGQPVVHNDRHATWFFGESAAARTDTLRSLKAPDFTLPDLDGNLHSLSDYRGRKVLLLSWASW
jgi:hypothetical protein